MSAFEDFEDRLFHVPEQVQEDFDEFAEIARMHTKTYATEDQRALAFASKRRQVTIDSEPRVATAGAMTWVEAWIPLAETPRVAKGFRGGPVVLTMLVVAKGDLHAVQVPMGRGNLLVLQSLYEYFRWGLRNLPALGEISAPVKNATLWYKPEYTTADPWGLVKELAKNHLGVAGNLLITEPMQEKDVDHRPVRAADCELSLRADEEEILVTARVDNFEFDFGEYSVLIKNILASKQTLLARSNHPGEPQDK